MKYLKFFFAFSDVILEISSSTSNFLFQNFHRHLIFNKMPNIEVELKMNTNKLYKSISIYEYLPDLQKSHTARDILEWFWFWFWF